jgi:hypothetical protein
MGIGTKAPIYPSGLSLGTHQSGDDTTAVIFQSETRHLVSHKFKYVKERDVV